MISRIEFIRKRELVKIMSMSCMVFRKFMISRLFTKSIRDMYISRIRIFDMYISRIQIRDMYISRIHIINCGVMRIYDACMCHLSMLFT